MQICRPPSGGNIADSLRAKSYFCGQIKTRVRNERLAGADAQWGVVRLLLCELRPGEPQPPSSRSPFILSAPGLRACLSIDRFRSMFTQTLPLYRKALKEPAAGIAPGSACCQTESLAGRVCTEVSRLLPDAASIRTDHFRGLPLQRPPSVPFLILLTGKTG
jgi:hypothetical protein